MISTQSNYMVQTSIYLTMKFSSSVNLGLSNVSHGLQYPLDSLLLINNPNLSPHPKAIPSRSQKTKSLFFYVDS